MRTLIPMLLAFVVGFFAVRQLTEKWLRSELVPVQPLAKAAARQEEPAPVPPSPAVEPAIVPDVARAVIDPQADLTSAITFLHDHLQAGDYVEAMWQYMPPSTRKSMPVERLAELKKSFEAASQPGTVDYERVQYMIRVLQAIQGALPEMNNVADIATFPVPVAAPAILGGRGPETIKFYLEDGRWYLR